MELDSVREQVKEGHGGVVALRRTLHQHPEVGNDLPVTRDLVLAALDTLPLTVTAHRTTSGIAALLEGDKPGPTVLLRGDMDALPLHEDTGLDFVSKSEGTMHACGHDTHTAMLVGAARLLAERKGEIAGRVLFMFQPGEEGHHGAKYMLDEGLLEVPNRSDGSESPVTAAYAVHITSMMPSGWISSRPGPIMASSDTLLITVTGRGGHASEPYRALDPIPIACEIVQALQTMVTRSINVFDPGVVTVGRITAGTTSNISPATAMLEGTIRAVSEDPRRRVHDGIRRVAEGVAAAHDAAVEVQLTDGYGVTVNGDDPARRALDTARQVAGLDHVIELAHPIMGAEDFSYVLNRLPGAMLFLGGTPEGKDPATAAPNHSNRVLFDEAAMQNGVALYSALALEHLSAQS